MKLHLPSPLRTALLACLALAAPCATLAAATLAVGTVTLHSAYAADLYYDGGIISSWEDGAIMGDTAFHNGDNVVFGEGNTSATLGDNITVGSLNIHRGAILTLDGAGHTLTAKYITLNGLLRLKSQALAGTTDNPATIYSEKGVVEVAWGDTAGSLSSFLPPAFTGALRVNDSTYALAATELQNASQTLEILSGSTIQAAAGTYVAAVVSEGQNTMQAGSGTATFSGELSGNGTLTKTGAGILRFTTDLYHTGDLVINEGTVQWGNATQNAFNTMVFSSIQVNNGATFEDSHLGTAMQHRTDVYLNGGTISSFDERRPASGMTGLSENYYKSLHVSGTSAMNYTWKGIRRFGLLASEGTDAVTLNINNSNEDSQTIFERIENFHGSIGGAAKNDRNRIYIGEVSQAAGHAMTINHNTHSQNLNKSGAGSLTITGALTVEETLTLQEGPLTVRGATAATDTSLSGGSLEAAALAGDTYQISGTANATHTGDVTLTEDLSINTKGTVRMTNARSDGSVTIAGGTVTLSGSLTGHDSLDIAGGAITAVNAVGGNFRMSGGSLSLSGNMEVDSFRLSDGNLSFTGASGALTVHKELNMNYNGSLNHSSLSLDNGIVLSYSPGASHTIEIPSGSGAYGGLNHISINLLGLTAQDLRNGVNLGIAASVDSSIFNISTLEKGSYTLANKDGYWFLQTNSPQVTARTMWDRNWGDAIAASAPAGIKRMDWRMDGPFDPGLYNDPYFTCQNYDTAADLTGSSGSRSTVYGGGYGTAHIDGSGGAVDRNVWLYARGGYFHLIAGGSYNADVSWNLGAAGRAVDTHLAISGGTSAGAVIAGHMRAFGTTTWTGDGYLSVYSGDVSGSVVGGSVHSTQNPAEATHSHTGNSTLFIYAPLATSRSTVVVDTTRTDTEEGLRDYVYGGVICGGSINNHSNHTSTQTGDNFITIDFAGTTSRDDMGKSIAGGHFGSGIQQQTGDTTVRILNTHGIDFTGSDSDHAAIAAGHLSYPVDPDGDETNQLTASEQSQTGNATLELSNTGTSNFPRLIGGHGSVENTAAHTQSRIGNTTVSLTGVNGNVTSLTGGHYSTQQTATQSQTGDISITIGNSRVDVANFLTGGHYSSTNNNTSTQNLTGSINIAISNGTYDRVVAGHVMKDTRDPDDPVGTRGTYTGSITEGTNLLITGGTFGTVQGGSYINCHTNITSSIGDVNMQLKGGVYEEIIGGYAINTENTDGTSASIGNIDISLSNVYVTGAIYGGSKLTSNAPALLQRNITLDIVSGTFLGNIYAAGSDLEDRNGNGTGPITESTTVNISRNATFASGITISGGYESGTTGSGGSSGSIVTNKTLAFVDSGTYSQASMGCTYTYFDAVDVTEGATVTLTQRLQEMAQSVTKMGEGTLKLGSRNRVDNVQVTEGTLALQGGSRSLTAIELLQVAKDATLDISAGNCGINGKLVMENGSTLAVNAAQAASSLQELQWSTDGLVNISIADAPTEGNYTIELFNDRTKAGGLMMESISGIEFDEMDGKYVASASDYLQCPDFSLVNAYLVLREDGTLVLTNEALRSLHWAGNDGDVWNVRQNVAWAPHDDEAPSTNFLNGSNVIFTKDGSEGNPMTVAVAENVSPADMTFSQGFYEFTTDAGAAIATDKRITLTEATVDMGALLDTSEKTPSLTLVDDGSRFNADNDIHLNKLNNNGTVTIGGNLALDRGTDNGGNLTVGGDLKLGGSSSFDALTAQNVTGNKGRTLTTGKDASGASSIASIDGGSLIVNKGSLGITTNQKTGLDSIGGAGSLTANGNLALAQYSRIGNLTAPSLTLSRRLDVDNTLTTSSIALDNLQLDAPGQAHAMVKAKTIAAAGSSPLDVTVADSVVSRQVLEDGETYYLVHGQGATAGTSFTINGQSEQYILSHRYKYHLMAEENGVSITGIVTNYHFYEDNALTENGRTGAKMLDALFRDGSSLAKDPNGDLRKALDAMDDLLIRQRRPEAADTLAAAVAGSTIPTMAMAFSGDMERQLKSIRNRTTTMGLGSECLTYENLPYFNAWVNAEGNHQELDADTTYTGYKLDSWGGTLGLDMDVSNSFTCGFAITALMGNYSADGADSLDGDLDTQYLTLFARYYKRAWVQTIVASLGRADISYDRTVAIPGNSGYTTSGSTDGMGFGLMYEVGYVMALNEAATACLQPVVNVTLAHTSISGYTESGGNASLRVDDMDMSTLTFGAGARLQAAFGENIYNRTSLFEARALVKFVAGDRRGESDNAFAAAEQINGTLKSAELGSAGLEIGAGLTVPVGAEAGAIFADVSAEVQSGYSAVNGTIGYRVNF